MGNLLLRPLWHALRRWQGLCSALACSACVGSGLGVPTPPDPATSVPKTWPEIQAQILEPTCAAPCHHGGASPKGLALDHGSAWKSLVGVASSEAPGMLRVAPGMPDQSYLIVKVTASDPRRIGARMPRTGPPFLSSAQVTALRQWIAAGASQDWVAGSADAETLSVPVPDAGGEVPDADQNDPDQSDADHNDAGSTSADAAGDDDAGSTSDLGDSP